MDSIPLALVKVLVDICFEGTKAEAEVAVMATRATTRGENLFILLFMFVCENLLSVFMKGLLLLVNYLCLDYETS